MGISLRKEHLKRYKDLIWLLTKYGRADIVKDTGLQELAEKEEKAAPAKADELPRDLQELGPTYIKLGQFFSTRADILSPPYLRALEQLQDNVDSFEYDAVEHLFYSEIGVRISKAFSEFDREPLAAASLAQVHRARLRSGQEVAVKVQRPNIRERVLEDLDAFMDIAEFFDKHSSKGRIYRLADSLEEFRKAMLHEMDFNNERQNLLSFSANLRDYDKIVIPQPIPDYCSSRILTMDYISGKNLSHIRPIGLIEMEREGLAEQLFKAYLEQILIQGFFHADPHPGNILLTDSQKLALLDLGMVARIPTSSQRKLLRLLLAISDGKGEEAARIAMDIGTVDDYFDETSYIREAAALTRRYTDVPLEELQVGRVVLEMMQIASSYGIRLPTNLTLLGKTLLNLDKIGRTLAPEFDPTAAVKKYSAEIIKKQMSEESYTKNLYDALMDTKEFITFLPSRINTILETIAENKLSLNVDAIDERYLMVALQKIANRLTLGMVLAAMILAASLLMQVETTFKLFGYPGLAIIFFVFAAIGGLILMFKILLHDESSKHVGGKHGKTDQK